MMGNTKESPYETSAGSFKKAEGRPRRPNLAEAMNMQGDVSITPKIKRKLKNTQSTKKKFRRSSGSGSSSSSRASLIDLDDMNVL